MSSQETVILPKDILYKVQRQLRHLLTACLECTQGKIASRKKKLSENSRVVILISFKYSAAIDMVVVNQDLKQKQQRM